jgi:predicted DNA-binding transcriptional regulator AlpA
MGAIVAEFDADALVEAVAARVADLVDERAAARLRLVETAQAAEVLGVPESWLATRARNGEAPCRRLGKYVRFDLGELRAWIDATTASGPGAGLGPVSSGADRQRLSASSVSSAARVPSVVPSRAA